MNTKKIMRAQVQYCDHLSSDFDYWMFFRNYFKNCIHTHRYRHSYTVRGTQDARGGMF